MLTTCLSYTDDTTLKCSGPSNYDVATEMNHIWSLDMGEQDEAKS